MLRDRADRQLRRTRETADPVRSLSCPVVFSDRVLGGNRPEPKSGGDGKDRSDDPEEMDAHSGAPIAASGDICIQKHKPGDPPFSYFGAALTTQR